MDKKFLKIPLIIFLSWSGLYVLSILLAIFTLKTYPLINILFVMPALFAVLISFVICPSLIISFLVFSIISFRMKKYKWIVINLVSIFLIILEIGFSLYVISELRGFPF
jgi:hypothetical protein